MVRPGVKSEAARLLRALRHGAHADEAGGAAAQGQYRGRRKIRASQRTQWLRVSESRRAEHVSRRLGAHRRRHPDSRHDPLSRQQVGTFFTQVEQPTLRALPTSLFPCFEEAPRKVHRDGHVAYHRAYYSVPPEHVGCDVSVRAETRLVRIYNQRFVPIAIAVHVRAEPGRFATDQAHLHSHKRVIVERGANYLLERCRLLGAHCGAWAEGLMAQRGPEALRVLQGLLALARDHPIGELERACGRAVHIGLWRLKEVRRLLQHGEQVVQVDFLQAHPLIRDLSHYQLEP